MKTDIEYLEDIQLIEKEEVKKNFVLIHSLFISKTSTIVDGASIKAADLPPHKLTLRPYYEQLIIKGAIAILWFLVLNFKQVAFLYKNIFLIIKYLFPLWFVSEEWLVANYYPIHIDEDFIDIQNHSFSWKDINKVYWIKRPKILGYSYNLVFILHDDSINYFSVDNFIRNTNSMNKLIATVEYFRQLVPSL